MRGIRAGDAAVGLLVAVLGLVGLIQAAGATDNEIYVFGLSLLAFAVAFDFGLLRRHFDTAGQWPDDPMSQFVWQLDWEGRAEDELVCRHSGHFGETYHIQYLGTPGWYYWCRH